MHRVMVNGAAGKMGKYVCRAIHEDKELKLIGGIDPKLANQDLNEMLGLPGGEIKSHAVLAEALSAEDCDTVVDFTTPRAVKVSIETVLRMDKNMVVGTTGISRDEIFSFQDIVDKSKGNLFVAPNFAIGAVLMMQVSKIIAKFMPDVEIIELHHNQKEDAPSGTSILTAHQIAENIKEIKDSSKLKENEIVPNVRGGKVNNINIHSIRLPGLIAHQEVIFGTTGQTLKVRHDSIDRSSFMPGILMAIKAVPDHPGITYGLDKLMEL